MSNNPAKLGKLIALFSFTSIITILGLLWGIFGYILDRDAGFLAMLIIMSILAPSSVGGLVFFSIRFSEIKKRIRLKLTTHK